MAALSSSLRDKWDGITPRERALVVVLGISAVVTVFLAIGMSISDRLDSMESSNNQMRKALKVLQDYDVYGRPDKAQGPEVNIGATPLQLDSYIEKAAGKSGVTVPAYKPRSPQTKPNGYVQHTVELSVNGLSMQQLTGFLEALESDNKLVVVSALNVKRSFSDREKVDVRMEVSTYSNPNAAAAAGAAAGTGAGTGTAAPTTPATGGPR